MASLLQVDGRIRSRNGVICPFSIPHGMVLVTENDHVPPRGLGWRSQGALSQRCPGRAKHDQKNKIEQDEYRYEHLILSML